MMRRFLLVAVLAVAGFGCHHANTPTTTAGLTLPPSTGTPVGILIDEATALHLRDDQVTKLRELDTQLATRNDPIDAQLRMLDQPPGPPPSKRGNASQARAAMAGGPKIGNGRRHRMGAAGNADGDRQRLTAERTANAREVVTHALDILDVDQRDAATKLLADHGVDLTAPAPKATTEESQESTEAPDDPTEF